MNNRKEIISYLIFGVLTTVVNIATFAIVYDIMRLDYKIATTIAWIISVLFAFITNKHFVYNSKSINAKIVIREFVSFIIFRILSYVIDLVMMIIMIDGYNMNSIYAKVIANIFVVVINYFASKFFIFRYNNEDATK